MHTDSTLHILSLTTTALGNSLRAFKETTCSLFQTRELERERVARHRRQQNKLAETGEGVIPAPNKTRRPKHLNLKTYKFHALGDYVSTIRRFGTTDSYTSQTVCYFPFDP